MRFASLALMFLLVCCSCGRKADNGFEEPLNTRLVSLPDGTEIRAEVLINPTEMARGMPAARSSKSPPIHHLARQNLTTACSTAAITSNNTSSNCAPARPGGWGFAPGKS